ncbi:1949_t:CDS:2, partial [Scutellospora calospora]
MLTKKQVILSVAQKHEICKKKEINLIIKNINLTNNYNVNNMLNSGQDIDRYILKEKAKFFADHLLIDNFYQSNSWLT